MYILSHYASFCLTIHGESPLPIHVPHIICYYGMTCLVKCVITSTRTVAYTKFFVHYGNKYAYVLLL